MLSKISIKHTLFLKSNGSWGKGGGGGASTSYEGTSKGYGEYLSFNNPGYDKIKDLPSGAEFTVSSSRLSLGVQDVRYKVLMVNGERQLVIMNNNGKRDLVYNSAATADTSHFPRNITDADLRRLVGDDARKITIHNGGKPINSKTRDNAEEAYHALLRSGQELGRTEYRIIDSGERPKGLGSEYTNKAGIREAINSPDGTKITVHSDSWGSGHVTRHFQIERRYDGTYLRQINEQGFHSGSRSLHKINSMADFTKRTQPRTIIVHGRDLDQEARATTKSLRDTERRINRAFREDKAKQKAREQATKAQRRAEQARQARREQIAAANRAYEARRRQEG